MQIGSILIQAIQALNTCIVKNRYVCPVASGFDKERYMLQCFEYIKNNEPSSLKSYPWSNDPKLIESLHYRLQCLSHSNY